MADPITILHVVGAALGGAQQAGQLGYQLYQLIQKTKSIDDTVKSMQTEIMQLEDVCNAVAEQFRLIPKAPAVEKLLKSIDDQINSCTVSMQCISEKILPVSNVNNEGFIKKTIGQIRLNFSDSDIAASRRQIQSSIANLQVSLQLVNIQSTYLAPRLANEELLDKLDELQNMVLIQGAKLDKNLKERAGTYLSEGRSLYAESLAGGSVIGLDPTKHSAIATWVDHLMVLKQDDVNNESSLQSQEDVKPREAEPVDLESVPLDEDQLTIEITSASLQTGREAYERHDYVTAEAMLGDCLVSMREINIRDRQQYDLEEIHLMLALCTSQGGKSTGSAAEAALVSVLRSGLQSDRNEHLHFKALQDLVVIYLKTGRLDLARSSCKSLYEGTRQRFGKNHTSTHRQLAMLARIYELQNNSARAISCRSLIPADRKEIINQVARVTSNISDLSNGHIAEKRADDLEQDLSGQRSSQSTDTLISSTDKTLISPPRTLFTARSVETARTETSQSLDWDQNARKEVNLASGYDISSRSARHRCGVDGLPHAMAWSNNNAFFAYSVYSVYTLTVCSLLDSSTKWTVTPSDQPSASLLAFDSQGTRLASCHSGFVKFTALRSKEVRKPPTIYVWSVETGELLHCFTHFSKQDTFNVTSLLFTHSDRNLAYTYDNDRDNWRAIWKEKLVFGYVIRDCQTGVVRHGYDFGRKSSYISIDSERGLVILSRDVKTSSDNYAEHIVVRVLGESDPGESRRVVNCSGHEHTKACAISHNGQTVAVFKNGKGMIWKEGYRQGHEFSTLPTGNSFIGIALIGAEIGFTRTGLMITLVGHYNYARKLYLAAPELAIYKDLTEEIQSGEAKLSHDAQYVYYYHFNRETEVRELVWMDVLKELGLS